MLSCTGILEYDLGEITTSYLYKKFETGCLFNDKSLERLSVFKKKTIEACFCKLPMHPKKKKTLQRGGVGSCKFYTSMETVENDSLQCNQNKTVHNDSYVMNQL